MKKRYYLVSENVKVGYDGFDMVSVKLETSEFQEIEITHKWNGMKYSIFANYNDAVEFAQNE